jgi:hypothetical protein
MGEKRHTSVGNLGRRENFSARLAAAVAVAAKSTLPADAAAVAAADAAADAAAVAAADAAAVAAADAAAVATAAPSEWAPSPHESNLLYWL